MKLLDLTLPSPVENLACDEALLDWCENGKGEEVLRFWEPREHFVVVGYANKIANEVNVAACEKRDIPILRRCSGGGTVLQCPGCLNYALVLRITDDGPLRNISSANQFIMERNRAAIESLFRTFNLQPLGAAKPGGDGSSFILHPSSFILSVCGHTDLVIGGRKFSGNSQRRRKNSLLFHGTFLLDFDLPLIGEFLQMPSKQPDYRQNRAHGEFLVNLKIPAEQLKNALAKVWNASEELHDCPKQETHRLAVEKYSTAKWNFRL
jgi:lipoate-protein ligase A